MILVRHRICDLSKKFLNVFTLKNMPILEFPLTAASVVAASKPELNVVQAFLALLLVSTKQTSYILWLFSQLYEVSKEQTKSIITISNQYLKLITSSLYR